MNDLFQRVSESSIATNISSTLGRPLSAAAVQTVWSAVASQAEEVLLSGKSFVITGLCHLLTQEQCVHSGTWNVRRSYVPQVVLAPAFESTYNVHSPVPMSHAHVGATAPTTINFAQVAEASGVPRFVVTDLMKAIIKELGTAAQRDSSTTVLSFGFAALEFSQKRMFVRWSKEFVGRFESALGVEANPLKDGGKAEAAAAIAATMSPKRPHTANYYVPKPPTMNAFPPAAAPLPPAAAPPVVRKSSPTSRTARIPAPPSVAEALLKGARENAPPVSARPVTASVSPRATPTRDRSGDRTPARAAASGTPARTPTQTPARTPIQTPTKFCATPSSRPLANEECNPVENRSDSEMPTGSPRRNALLAPPLLDSSLTPNVMLPLPGIPMTPYYRHKLHKLHVRRQRKKAYFDSWKEQEESHKQTRALEKAEDRKLAELFKNSAVAEVTQERERKLMTRDESMKVGEANIAAAQSYKGTELPRAQPMGDLLERRTDHHKIPKDPQMLVRQMQDRKDRAAKQADEDRLLNQRFYKEAKEYHHEVKERHRAKVEEGLRFYQSNEDQAAMGRDSATKMSELNSRLAEASSLGLVGTLANAKQEFMTRRERKEAVVRDQQAFVAQTLEQKKQEAAQSKELKIKAANEVNHFITKTVLLHQYESMQRASAQLENREQLKQQIEEKKRRIAAERAAANAYHPTAMLKNESSDDED